MNFDLRLHRQVSDHPYPLMFATILVHLNETFKLPYLPDLIDRKTSGTEKGTLDQADLSFHEREYERLRTELVEAFAQSRLPEQPSGAAALNDLLVRTRLGGSSIDRERTARHAK